MIAGAAMLPASTPPPPAAAGGNPANAAGSTAADGAPRPAITGAKTPAANAATGKTTGNADDAARGSAFDALLSDAGVSPTSAAPLPVALPTTGKPLTAAEPLAVPPAEVISPEQLLAMIDGSWARPAIPAAAPIAVPPPAPGLFVAADATPLPAAASAATTIAATASLAAQQGTIEGREFGAAGSLVEFTETGLVSELGSEPAPLTGPIAATATGAARPTAMAVTSPILLPADPDAGFDDAFGSRIAWMAEQRLGHAEIRVTPEHAGPIDVRLQLDGTRVSADFQSSNPEVRHALEASMTRLREMLEQHGLRLAHAGVGSGHSDRRGGPDVGHGHDHDRDADLDPRMTATPIRGARGLLDEYA